MAEKEAILAVQSFDETSILNQLEQVNKALIHTLKFQMIYSFRVSEKQEKKTAEAIKEYRDEFWTAAMKKAKGNKEKAYNIYTENLKELF